MFENNLRAQKHLESSTREKEAEQRRLREKLMTSQHVAVNIPPIYKRRLGANLPLTLGTQTITVPVNGRTYMVPKGFAEVLQRHLHQINIEETRSQGSWGGESGDVSPHGPIPGRD